MTDVAFTDVTEEELAQKLQEGAEKAEAPAKKAKKEKQEAERKAREEARAKAKAEKEAAKAQREAERKEKREAKESGDFGPCRCGCGATKKSFSAMFIPGHDAKAKSLLSKANEAKGKGETVPEVPAILMEYAQSNPKWVAWFPNLFAKAE